MSHFFGGRVNLCGDKTDIAGELMNSRVLLLPHQKNIIFCIMRLIYTFFFEFFLSYLLLKQHHIPYCTNRKLRLLRSNNCSSPTRAEFRSIIAQLALNIYTECNARIQ